MTVAKGHKIMIASGEAGAFIHPADDNDTELEEIYQRNVIAFRSKKLEMLTCEVDGTWDAAQALLALQRKMKVFHVPWLCAAL